MGRLELDKKIKISTETAYRFVLQDKAVGGALYKYNTFAEYTKVKCTFMTTGVRETYLGYSTLIIYAFWALCGRLYSENKENQQSP
jgi:hypothetical protein